MEGRGGGEKGWLISPGTRSASSVGFHLPSGYSGLFPSRAAGLGGGGQKGEKGRLAAPVPGLSCFPAVGDTYFLSLRYRHPAANSAVSI